MSKLINIITRSKKVLIDNEFYIGTVEKESALQLINHERELYCLDEKTKTFAVCKSKEEVENFYNNLNK